MVATALQLLRTRGMRVFFYLDDLIVMARSRERAMWWALRSIGRRAPPYLTNRHCIWEWCSMQVHSVPPCQRADARPYFGRFAGCDRGQQ